MGRGWRKKKGEKRVGHAKETREKEGERGREMKETEGGEREGEKGRRKRVREGGGLGRRENNLG